eukprot:19312_1
MAFARLSYSCFQDKEQEKLWNDAQNSIAFNKYLETKINNESDSKSSDSKSNEPPENDDEKQFKDDDGDTCVGIDDKEKILSKGGNKINMNEINTCKSEKLQYTKNVEIDKICKSSKLMSETGNVETVTCFGEDKKGRALYIGPKGGIYYLTDS